jgi:hypothetical protein
MTDRHDAPRRAGERGRALPRLRQHAPAQRRDPRDLVGAASLRMPGCASERSCRGRTGRGAARGGAPRVPRAARAGAGRHAAARRAEGLPSTAQVRRLNTVLREGVHYHELRSADEGTRFTVGQVGDDLEQARAAIAGSLAHYIADHDARPAARLRQRRMPLALRRPLPAPGGAAGATCAPAATGRRWPGIGRERVTARRRRLRRLPRAAQAPIGCQTVLISTNSPMR